MYNKRPFKRRSSSLGRIITSKSKLLEQDKKYPNDIKETDSEDSFKSSSVSSESAGSHLDQLNNDLMPSILPFNIQSELVEENKSASKK